MADKDQEPVVANDLDAAKAEMQALLGELKKVKTQADEKLKTIEQTRTNFDARAASAASEVQDILDNIKKFKQQADDQLKAVDSVRKDCDSHATYASQAKNNCEKHAKDAASLKGTAESDQNSIATNKQKSDELIAAVTRAKTDIDADLNAIHDQRRSVDQATGELVKTAASAAAYFKEIEQSKSSADSSLKITEQAQHTANQACQKTKASQQAADQFTAQTKDLLDTADAMNKQICEASEDIKTLLGTAKDELDEIKQVLEKLEKSNETATRFEERVHSSADAFYELKAKIESLLPSAASASLASAFASQKKRFWFPKYAWLIVFILCIGGLIWVAYPSFNAAVSETMVMSETAVSDVAVVSEMPVVSAPFANKTWTDIFRCMLLRLPIVLPLIWLAIYAGRNYMLSIRLEEDYAYKEALSTAFEGYKREMANIASEGTGNDKPLITLCVNVLKAIAERPGRMYDSKQKDITLQNEVVSAAQEVVDLSKRPVAE